MTRLENLARAVWHGDSDLISNILSNLPRPTTLASPDIDPALTDLEAGRLVLRYFAPDGRGLVVRVFATFLPTARVRVTGSNRHSRRDKLESMLISAFAQTAPDSDLRPINLPPELA